MVYTLAVCLVLLVLYAATETVLFLYTARRAAETDLLRQRVRELESSSQELSRMGKELSEIKEFEQRVRRVLAGHESASGEELTWNPSGPGVAASPVGEARSLGLGSYTAMDIPTLPPVRGYVTRDFSTDRTTDLRSHHGLDIAAKQGVPVVSSADGLVVFSGWSYPYGNLVVVQHRSGYVSFYGHNQVLLVRPGDRVRQGEPLGLLGNSGVSSAPHLHFEIWRDGAPLDPVALLRDIP